MKKVIVLSIVFLGVVLSPKIASAFFTYPVGGVFDGENLTFPCGVFPEHDTFHTYYFGISTSTSPEYFGVGVSGGGGVYSDETGGSFQAYCQSIPDISFATSTFDYAPADTYYLFYGLQSVGDDYPDDFDWYYIEVEWNGETIIDYTFYSDETRFTYLYPHGGQEVATSTENTFYIGVFTNENDYIEGNYVRLKYVRQQDLQASVADTDLLWTSIDFSDPVFGSIDTFISTTTGDLGLTGTYLVKLELRKPASWWSTALWYINPLSGSLDPDIIVASSSQFVYGEMTSFDHFVASTTDAFNDLLGNTSATSTMALISDACNPINITSFDIGKCLAGIFAFNIPENTTALYNMKDNLLSYFPIGYITRTLEIIATTGTTTLPAVDYTFQSSSPLAGENINLDPWPYLSFTDEASPLAQIKSDIDGDEKTIWEIAEPFYNFLIYTLLVILIIGDIMGIAVGSGGSYMSRRRGEGSKRNRNPSAYREWLYTHRK